MAFGASSLLLALLVLLDYYENCSMYNCAEVHHLLGWAYVFDYAYLVPTINSLSIPITLRLIVPCLALFAMALVSVFILKLQNRVGKALFATFRVALIAILLFEGGLYYFSPDWWTIHFSNFSQYPFSIVTNEVIFYISLIVLLCATLLPFFIQHTPFSSLTKVWRRGAN